MLCTTLTQTLPISRHTGVKENRIIEGSCVALRRKIFDEPPMQQQSAKKNESWEQYLHSDGLRRLHRDLDRLRRQREDMCRMYISKHTEEPSSTLALDSSESTPAISTIKNSFATSRQNIQNTKRQLFGATMETSPRLPEKISLGLESINDHRSSFLQHETLDTSLRPALSPLSTEEVSSLIKRTSRYIHENKDGNAVLLNARKNLRSTSSVDAPFVPIVASYSDMSDRSQTSSPTMFTHAKPMPPIPVSYSPSTISTSLSSSPVSYISLQASSPAVMASHVSSAPASAEAKLNGSPNLPRQTYQPRLSTVIPVDTVIDKDNGPVTPPSSAHSVEGKKVSFSSVVTTIPSQKDAQDVSVDDSTSKITLVQAAPSTKGYHNLFTRFAQQKNKHHAAPTTAITFPDAPSVAPTLLHPTKDRPNFRKSATYIANKSKREEE